MILFFKKNNKGIPNFIKINQFINTIKNFKELKHFFWRHFFSQQELKNFFGEKDFSFFLETIFEKNNRFLSDMDGINEHRKNQNIDLSFWLTNDILHKIDRSSMFNGLEVRSPFLEKEILNYSLSLKIDNLISPLKLRKKIPLINEYLNLFKIKNIKKNGFNSPFYNWFLKDKVNLNYLKEFIITNLGLGFNKKITLDLLNSNKIEMKFNAHKIYNLFILSKLNREVKIF